MRSAEAYYIYKVSLTIGNTLLWLNLQPHGSAINLLFEDEAMPKLVRLENKQGMKVSLTDFGCRIVSIQLPIKGQLMDMVVNYPQVDDYLNDVFIWKQHVGPYVTV
jgi:aldose 1-epimerase